MIDDRNLDRKARTAAYVASHKDYIGNAGRIKRAAFAETSDNWAWYTTGIFGNFWLSGGKFFSFKTGIPGGPGTLSWACHFDLLQARNLNVPHNACHFNCLKKFSVGSQTTNFIYQLCMHMLSFQSKLLWKLSQPFQMHHAWYSSDFYFFNVRPSLPELSYVATGQTMTLRNLIFVGNLECQVVFPFPASKNLHFTTRQNNNN